jgi:hypothetical protein
MTLAGLIRLDGAHASYTRGMSVVTVIVAGVEAVDVRRMRLVLGMAAG